MTTPLHPVLEAALKRMEAGGDRQAKGVLSEVDLGGVVCFCALGIIADEWVKAHPDEMHWEHDDGFENDLYLTNRTNNYRCRLPHEMMRALGIHPGVSRSITFWNDYDGLPFSEIAARLKERLAEA